MHQQPPAFAWGIQTCLWAMVWWEYQQLVPWKEHTPTWLSVQALVPGESGTWLVCAWFLNA